MPVTWRMGDITFHVLEDGTFRGDGGVFFGAVPKAVWRRRQAVDEENTFDVPVRPVLAEMGGRRILVETGMGDPAAREEKFAGFWGLKQPVTLRDELAALGVEPGSIDLVVLTHLHFDHCGWNAVRGAGGRLEPFFPRATYLVQRREYADARYPDELNKASYLAENLLPVEEAGRWRFLEGDGAIAPGVEVRLAPGHVPWLQLVKFTASDGQVAVVASDLIPARHHVRPGWNTAYDLEPAVNAASKKRFLRDAAPEGWHLFLYHDPDVLLSRVTSEGRLDTVLDAAGRDGGPAAAEDDDA